MIIAGAGNLQPYRELIENPQIEIINRFLSDDEVNECFLRAKIVVMPYIEASQSGVIASAYTFGKAIIATDVGSISETLKPGENGELIPARDVNALTKAMIYLAQNEHSIQKYAQNNRLASMLIHYTNY